MPRRASDTPPRIRRWPQARPATASSHSPLTLLARAWVASPESRSQVPPPNGLRHGRGSWLASLTCPQSNHGGRRTRNVWVRAHAAHWPFGQRRRGTRASGIRGAGGVSCEACAGAPPSSARCTFTWAVASVWSYVQLYVKSRQACAASRYWPAPRTRDPVCFATHISAPGGNRTTDTDRPPARTTWSMTAFLHP